MLRRTSLCLTMLLLCVPPGDAATDYYAMMHLPGGDTARICIKRDLTPGGRDFIGADLQPDLKVSPTVPSVRPLAQP